LKTDSSCEAVLFDLDGTLLDTVEDLADCMNATLAADGLPTVPTERHKLMVGDGVRAYVLRALPEDRHGDEDYLRDFTARFRTRYGENWATKTRPYDGVPELLQRLGEIGLPTAILSNKPDHATRGIVEHFLSAFTFAVVRGAMDGVPLKPDPAPALAVAREVGIEPPAFLYLGDTALPRPRRTPRRRRPAPHRTSSTTAGAAVGPRERCQEGFAPTVKVRRSASPARLGAWLSAGSEPELLLDESYEGFLDLGMAGNGRFPAGPLVRIDIMAPAVTAQITPTPDEGSNEGLALHTSTPSSSVFASARTGSVSASSIMW